MLECHTRTSAHTNSTRPRPLSRACRITVHHNDHQSKTTQPQYCINPTWLGGHLLATCSKAPKSWAAIEVACQRLVLARELHTAATARVSAEERLMPSDSSAALNSLIFASILSTWPKSEKKRDKMR